MEPNLHSFNIVLGACSRAADVASAHAYFARMGKANIARDAITYRTMVATCARAGKVALAHAWFAKMADASHPADVVVCSSLVSACAVAGDADGAEGWLRKMHDMGLVVGQAGYDPAIRAWASKGPSKEALCRAEGWLWKAIEAGVEPTDSALLALMAPSCARMTCRLRNASKELFAG